MALKFLNKKGWHTGSLRNIENVWKAEQKHDAEQKKLDELRKQILEERERSEFRLLQEQAGLVPRQERLEFLYDSGLAVGKGSGTSADGGGGSGSGFKALQSLPDPTQPPPSSSSSAAASVPHQQSSVVPGALFEDKPQSANDAWRKLHSDPLLLIRQREQESLARLKNNPVQMAMIRKSVDASKSKEKKSGSKDLRKHHGKKAKHLKDSSSIVEEETTSMRARKSSESERRLDKVGGFSERELRNAHKRRNFEKDVYRKQPVTGASSDITTEDGEAGVRSKRNRDKSKHGIYNLENHVEDSESNKKRREERHSHEGSSHGAHNVGSVRGMYNKRPHTHSKLSAEERAARLKEMQIDAELHEENRWKRIKKADEIDMQETTSIHTSGSRNFLDAAKRSVYGAEKGGSSTIEESVRRRTHYLQSRSEVGQGNAFRR